MLSTMNSFSRALAALILVLQCTSSLFVVGFSSIHNIIYNGQQKHSSSSSMLQSTSVTITTPETTTNATDIETDTDTDTTTTVTNSNSDKVNELATKLINKCKEYGQIGSKLTKEQQTIIDELASELVPYSDTGPAQVDLQGRHDLIYSASPGGSSGALGPFVGTVSQSFLDDERFINRVEIGPLKIELNADRKVLDEKRIRVMFKETAFYLFGKEVKRSDVKGVGVWDYQFSGKVIVNGERMFLRVLKTPSTFVIAQKEE